MKRHYHPIQGDAATFLRTARESAVAPRNTPHRWWNAGDEPAHVRIELRPGDTRFEEFIQIYYGIAADGGSDERGAPRNLLHAGYALVHGDIHLVGAQRALMPVLYAGYWVARLSGEGERLRKRYCAADRR